MRLQQFQPAEGLKKYVKWYWLLEIEAGELMAPQFLFPAGAIEIIFHLDNPLYRLTNEKTSAEHGAFMEGQQTTCMVVEQKGKVKTVGITLFPWATKYFFNIPPQIFNNKNFQAEEVDRKLSILNQQLLTAKNHEQLIGFCDSFFANLPLKYLR